MLYVRVNCFVVRGCAVSRRYINACNSDLFSVVQIMRAHGGKVMYFGSFALGMRLAS